MFNSRELSEVPVTRRYMGDPIRINKPNVKRREPDPDLINYSARVRIDAPIDSYVGQYVYYNDYLYSFNNKFSVSNDGSIYAITYRGYDLAYSCDFSSDPGWTDSNSMLTYSSDGYMEATINQAASPPSYIIAYYDLGLPNDVLSPDKYTIIRTTLSFNLPSVETSGSSIFYGVNDHTEADDSVSFGLKFSKLDDDNTYTISMYSGGALITNNSIPMTCEPLINGNLYVVDIIINPTDGSVNMVVYDSFGKIIFYGVGPADALDIGYPSELSVWSNVTGDEDPTIRFTAIEVWSERVIVKTSIDKGKTWNFTTDYPFDHCDSVYYASVAVNNSGNIVLGYNNVGTYSLHSIKYKYYVDGVWSSETTLAEAPGVNYTFKTVKVDKEDDDLYWFMWTNNSSSGTLQIEDVEIP